jgi:hypothetical protein
MYPLSRARVRATARASQLLDRDWISICVFTPSDWECLLLALQPCLRPRPANRRGRRVQITVGSSSAPPHQHSPACCSPPAGVPPTRSSQRNSPSRTPVLPERTKSPPLHRRLTRRLCSKAVAAPKPSRWLGLAAAAAAAARGIEMRRPGGSASWRRCACEARFRHLAALRELNLLLSERLLLSQLLVELFRNLALEAVEGGAEVVQDVSGAVAVSRSVVREVHWVLNHEVILVHLR